MTGAGGDCRRRHVDTVSGTVASASTYLERNYMPIVAATSGLQGWADLPDGLLQSIVCLLVSFPDLVAFAATCLSWRAACSSYPSKFSFSTLLPPLLLRSDVPLCSPRPCPFSSSLIPRRACHVTNLANQNVYMCCQIPLFGRFDKNGPPSPLDKFNFKGAFYGHLILTNKQTCLVVDVVTGASVSPPQLQFNKYSEIFYGMLTAPLASPNSHLLLSSGSCHFSWHVGSHSWREPFGPLNQIVAFKDKVIGMDYFRRLFILHLLPKILMQKIVLDEGSISETRHLYFKWLVACGDMLLMVVQSSNNAFEAFRLDLTIEPAKWVKVKNLENWAIFISIDQRTQPLCCMNPERWGGRSNCVYCCFEDSKGWMAFELGEPLPLLFMHCPSNMQPMWVVPSMFSA